MKEFERISSILKILSERNPHPKGELLYTNPYTLLVAVVLSAQATDKSVNKATRPLFENISTPQEMLDFGQDGLTQSIRSIGLYKTKAKNIISLSLMLIEQYDGNIPPSREALERLPGVGRKTANVVLNTAFNHHTIAIDTHLFRLSNRIPLALGKTPLDVEKGLLAIIPTEYLKDAHHWLILHGRYICKARAPLCKECPISNFCLYDKKIF